MESVWWLETKWPFPAENLWVHLLMSAEIQPWIHVNSVLFVAFVIRPSRYDEPHLRLKKALDVS